VWVDVLAVKCREAGRIVNVACVVATGVNTDGYREILGVDVLTSEDGAGWTAFLRDLVTRGLSGVELVVSDAHAGLREAIAAVLPGSSWQRCRTHFIRNLLCRVPKSAQGWSPPWYGRSSPSRTRLDPGPARPGGRAAHRPVPPGSRAAR
jgi:putative transposase